MENYVGKRLDGRYEILEIIGVGGMAVVYKAFDNIDERIVAVKILKDEFLENDEFRRRFKNESKAIAVLSHPNIVKVYDVSFGNMLQYIVMEYVEGITLKEYIEQQKVVNQREAVHFITQILRALQHAHDKGIIHRDIKPQNIMLISDGTIKVTDFGIAHFSRGETKTMSDQAIGSVHYISPEQAKGNVTDAKADIYSAGVVLYEMLTGSLPFQSENAVSVALMQLNNEAVRPRTINPEIAVGLEQITIRAMQKNPSDRYQSAAEMLLDIEAFKNNPDIKFDYSYFVDKQPTKFVPAAVAAVDEAEPPYIEPIEDDDSQNEVYIAENKSKKKTIVVLTVMLAVLVVFAGVLIASFWPDNNGSKVAVPSFIGLNYDKEIYGNSKYSSFKIEVEQVLDTSKENGVVIDQTPSANKKINTTDVITLKVVSDGTGVTVPDVYGYSISEAEEILKAKGFSVKTEAQYDLEHAVGTVIQTSPERNASADANSQITLYVATNQNTETVPVPILVGSTVDEAKKLLESVGLHLDTTNTEYRNSAEKAGTVIGNEHVGEEVPIGSSIAVYVSKGYVGSVGINFQLPSTGETGKIVVYVNDTIVEQSDVLLNGGSFQTSLKGSGTGDVVTVTIDGQTVYKVSANFITSQLNDDASSGAYTTESTTTTTTETTTKVTKPTTTEPKETKPPKTTESTTSAKTTESTTETTTNAKTTLATESETTTTEERPTAPVEPD